MTQAEKDTFALSVYVMTIELAVRFLNAGGDVVLFPEPTDFENILSAVQGGSLSIDRLKDAVLRFLRLKEKARLFEDQNIVDKEVENVENLSTISQQIADKKIAKTGQGLTEENMKQIKAKIVSKGK